VNIRKISSIAFSIFLAFAVAWSVSAHGAAGPATRGDDLSPEELASIERMVFDSPPTPPRGFVRPVVKELTRSVVSLPVPSSVWTYGCSPTAAGMIFAYYDRNGFPNMYTGPRNGGVAPLVNIGQGDNPASPIPGSCSIIATMNGFDGRTTPGHVDDYWLAFDQAGPDPWIMRGFEHSWGDCTADFMGTNQWKWDTSSNGSTDSNTDGATSFWFYNGGQKLHNHIPAASQGLPQTAGCHGMRLFAESRGYVVAQNYNQKIDAVASGGFTFNDYKAEIDAGRPVMVHIVGHTMVGVGYDTASPTIYFYDTWDLDLHSMAWGGSYAGSAHQAVTVFELSGAIVPTTEFHTAQASRVVSTGQFYAGAFSYVPTGRWVGSVDGYASGILNYNRPEDGWVGFYIYDYDAAVWTQAQSVLFTRNY